MRPVETYHFMIKILLTKTKYELILYIFSQNYVLIGAIHLACSYLFLA